MASKKLQLESLKNVPLFSACSKKDLEKVAKAADEITMTEGTMIVDQGQTGREAFVILSGEVTIKRLGSLCHRVHTSRDRPASLPWRSRRCPVDRSQADGRSCFTHPPDGPLRLRLINFVSDGGLTPIFEIQQVA
jgi:hypothetical protein